MSSTSTNGACPSGSTLAEAGTNGTSAASGSSGAAGTVVGGLGLGVALLLAVTMA